MELTPEMIKQYVEKHIAFVKRMGLKALNLEPRNVKLAAPLVGNENHIGSIYAGALFTLAEMPGGALFLTTFDASKYYPVIKEMTISFRRPATTDVTIEIGLSEKEVARIEAETQKNKKADFILKGEIKNKKGEVVAFSKGIYQLRVLGT